MGFLGSYPDEQQLPPWFSSVYANAPSGGSDPAAPPAVDPGAGKTVTPAAHPGFFGRIGQAIHSPDFRFRLQAALASAQGNPQAAMQYMEFAQQQAIRQQELQRQLRAEQRTEEDRNNQVWGLKQLNYSNPQIAAMNTADASHSVQTRSDPYTMSAGQTHVVPGLGGQQDQTTSAPTENQQNYSWLSGIPNGGPELARAFAEKQAYPGPIATQPGGGVAGFGTSPAHWVVQPNDMAPAAQPGGTGGTGGATGPGNNPGGLRYPGSTQFRNFQTPAAGIAAGQAQLGRYFGRGINTVRGIVETWAPRRSRGGDNSDESVNNYIGHVASRLGVNPDQPLPPSAIPQIFAAQTEFETGHRGPSPRLSVGGARGAPRAPVRVNSPAQAAALAPGTPFITPDGREGTRN